MLLLLNLAHVAAVLLPFVDPPAPYGPTDLFAGFADNALTVIPWVGAGIAAAIGLFFALLGIRKGLAWFFSIIRKA